jgi:hypothetical protein
MLRGAGQSLVGLFLSDRTVTQGLDTSQRGKGGTGRGGGGGERKRREDYAMVIMFTRALQFWGQ